MIVQWATVCLHESLDKLQFAFVTLLGLLQRGGQQTLAIPIAAAIVDRLLALADKVPDLGQQVIDRESMNSEALRLKSFRNWPHMDVRCLICFRGGDLMKLVDSSVSVITTPR